MKLLTILAIILIPALAFAAGPYLTCDPATDVNYYEIYRNDVLAEGNQSVEANGAFLYDLAGEPPDSSNWTAKACNDRGCSDTSDPYVLPALAGAPTGLKLEP